MANQSSSGSLLFERQNWQVATCLGPVENPELNAYFNKSSGQHILYRVRFTHAHLWGGNQTDEIYADLAGKWLCKAEG